MDFQSLQNDLKDWLKNKARAAASAARTVDNRVQQVEGYLGIKRQGPTPNPIRDPKGFAKDVLITKPVQTVKNIVNPVLTGLNVATSYPLGGSVKALSEVKKGTYQAPKTGVKIMGLDAGNFINPSIVGAVRGIKNKQTLFEEVPRAAGVQNPVGAFALGLASELAVPGPGGKGKALNKVREVMNADNLSKILSNSLKLNPTKIADKPNRLVGERWSFQEAMTGLTQTGKNLKGRIQIGINDAKQLVLEDGTHLLEAYRQLRKPIPLDKIAFTSDKAKKAFEKLSKKSGDIVENITNTIKPVQDRIDTVLEKTKITEKTIRSGFTRAINIAKSQDEAAKNVGIFVDRIMETGDQKLKELGQKAINAQLARFNAYRGSKKAEGLFQALEDGFTKLQDVPFGPKGMFTRLDAPKAPDAATFKGMTESTDPAKIINFPEVANKASELDDLNPFRSAFSDVYRNFEKVFKKGTDLFRLAEQNFLNPFNAAKDAATREQEDLMKALDENVVKGLGILKGSRLSALVQQFGEKRMSLEELQKTVPKDWEKVVRADEWFRGAYNSLIDKVNAVRAQIYPNNPDKIVPKREDYYRHFQEMAEGFGGLKNIFDSPANIPSNLAGVSEFTKPKSRWASFMQARTGDKTAMDAVGGFLNYIKAASYSIHIDPQIERFRGLANDLRQVTKDESGPLNNFIIYLDDFANDLSGKTNKLDRAVQDWIPGNRKTMAVMQWLNDRFKVNAIVGNISSAVNQTLSLPLGIADAKPMNAIKAVGPTLANIFKEGASINSAFLKERYLDSSYDAFNNGMIQNARKGAMWLLKNVEETSTRFIWNAEYNRALSEGVDDAIKAADDWTRKVVAGRGVGEVPLGQKSKLFQMGLPFQLEVANTWLKLKDFVDEKTFGKIVTFAVASNLLNSALQGVTGFRSGYDPIAALVNGLQNSVEGKEEGTGLYPLVGETLSNIPGGGFLTRAILNPDDTKKIFGQENDPTRFDRYGTGIPLASALKPASNLIGGALSGDGVKLSDAAQVIEYFALPFGGGQVKKTLAGAGMLASGGQFGSDQDGNPTLQFPTDPDFVDKAKALVFGPYNNDNARFYFQEELKPFTAKETKAWQAAVDAGADPTQKWLEIQQGKISRGLREKVQDVMKDQTIPPEEKTQKIDDIKREYDRLMTTLKTYQP